MATGGDTFGATGEDSMLVEPGRSGFACLGVGIERPTKPAGLGVLASNAGAAGVAGSSNEQMERLIN